MSTASQITNATRQAAGAATVPKSTISAGSKRKRMISETDKIIKAMTDAAVRATKILPRKFEGRAAKRVKIDDQSPLQSLPAASSTSATPNAAKCDGLERKFDVVGDANSITNRPLPTNECVFTGGIISEKPSAVIKQVNKAVKFTAKNASEDGNPKVKKIQNDQLAESISTVAKTKVAAAALVDVKETTMNQQFIVNQQLLIQQLCHSVSILTQQCQVLQREMACQRQVVERLRTFEQTTKYEMGISRGTLIQLLTHDMAQVQRLDQIESAMTTLSRSSTDNRDRLSVRPASTAPTVVVESRSQIQMPLTIEWMLPDRCKKIEKSIMFPNNMTFVEFHAHVEHLARKMCKMDVYVSIRRNEQDPLMDYTFNDKLIDSLFVSNELLFVIIVSLEHCIT